MTLQKGLRSGAGLGGTAGVLHSQVDQILIQRGANGDDAGAEPHKPSLSETSDSIISWACCYQFYPFYWLTNSCTYCIARVPSSSQFLVKLKICYQESFQKRLSPV